MLKRALALIPAMLLLSLTGCVVSLPVAETTEPYGYEYQTTAIVVNVTEESTAPAETTVIPSETASVTEPVTQIVTTVPAVQESTSVETTTAVPEVQTTQPMTEEPVVTDVDLSVSMPEKNGTMVTDSSADNKYIKIVCDEKGIDTALLIAVYAVPESGQNYVFEFYSADKITTDNIRRVYLIDAAGSISGVAASKSTERENVSVVENWFCMNVLIKEIIFPAVSGDIK